MRVRLRNKITGVISDFSEQDLQNMERLPWLKDRFEPVQKPVPDPPELKQIHEKKQDAQRGRKAPKAAGEQAPSGDV